MLNKPARNVYLDFFKVILSVMPISIHFGEKTFVPFCRMAIPAFFMISGYFLYRKDATLSENLAAAKSFITRTLTYFFCGIMFFFIYDVTLRLTIARDENLSNYIMYMFLPDIITNGLLLNRPVTTAFHLWYLLATLDVALIHWLLVKFDKTHWYCFIVPIGLFSFFFFGEYTEVLVGTSMPTEYFRNGLLMGLPMAGLGYCLAKNRVYGEKFYVKWIYLFAGAVFFVLQFFEAEFLEQECYVSSVFSAAFLLLFFTGLKSYDCKAYYKYVGAQLPYYVYVLSIATDNLLPDDITSSKTERVFIVFLVTVAVYSFCRFSIAAARYLKVRYSKRVLRRA